MWKAWERRELHAGLWFENKKSHKEDAGLDGKQMERKLLTS
jgi:hypothetical protein